MEHRTVEGEEGVLNHADSMPLISICMPTFKRTDFLRQALESALGQTYSNIEIIVSDDTPGDEIRDIVAGYSLPKLRYQKNLPALGFLPKLNRFLTEAKGEWMVILCDDDVFAPEFVERMVINAHRYPEASLLRARNSLIDVTGKLIRLDPETPLVSSPSRFLLDLFRPQSETFWVNLTGFMFRPQQLLALGGFTDLYAARHVDRLAWTELATLGPVICDDQSLCEIRLHGSSVSSSLESTYRDAIDATQTAKIKILQILGQVEKKAVGDGERDEIVRARQMLERYINEHTSRALRHGLIAELRKPDCSEERLGQLRAQWATMGLPVSRLTQVIFIVSKVPRFVRQPIVAAMLKYKRAYMH